MFIFWVPTSFCSTLPDAPVPKVDNSRFFDTPRTSIFVANVAASSFDTFTVCAGYSEAKEFHDKFLFTDNCKGVALQNGLFVFSSVALEYFLYKSGHPKLARIPQFINIGKSGYSSYYTFKHK